MEANFTHAQSGINTYQAIEIELNYSGRVSIIWNNVPKKHLKAVKELVKNCKEELISKVKVGYSTIPEHHDYTIIK